MQKVLYTSMSEIRHIYQFSFYYYNKGGGFI